ncbi:MAG: twin-arginine translocase TatA/TatE family subunit [Pseudomonadales bacterium]|jgi:sec-independent protein translocase protein TatA|nr:twin-arginine translocase TatA/TatE family subunit [Pseudomonadales bacterium]
MFGISLPQLLIILVIVLLLFGTSRLKNLGSDLGGAIRGFKKSMGDEEDAKPEEKPTDFIEGEAKRETVETERATDKSA